MPKKHENYKELIWALAKTDFKSRYQGSFLGCLWVILKPLMIFAVLNFVFSSVFSSGGNHYSLELLTGLVIFNFFSEGTVAGMTSLVSKSQLVTKIYVPRWAIILSSTVNAAMFFLINLLVISLFFLSENFIPDFFSVCVFFIFSIFIYILILSFSLFAAPFFVRFRDFNMVWDITLTVLMYASPVIYPLSVIPEKYHSIILLNPLAFAIHSSKQILIYGDFNFSGFLSFATLIGGGLIFGLIAYKKLVFKIAEEM
jgi:ABC-type polysaccharide/polyol phosphate export permease